MTDIRLEMIRQMLTDKLAEYPDGPTEHPFDAGYICALRFALDLLEEAAHDDP